jgi:uncharacterized protein (TIGR03435 family)
MKAYRARFFQISGPDWLASEHYDIAATIPQDATPQQFYLMLQNLLAERFHLVLHHETRDIRAYELAAGKNGPKLKESVSHTGADTAVPPSLQQLSPATRSMVLAGMPLATGTGVLMAGKARLIEALAEDLENILAVPVLDKTGLAGKYDYTLEFQRPGVDAAGDPLPSIFTAMEEQLGLRLEQKKLPFDVLVIDRADKVPTDN